MSKSIQPWNSFVALLRYLGSLEICSHKQALHSSSPRACLWAIGAFNQIGICLDWHLKKGIWLNCECNCLLSLAYCRSLQVRPIPPATGDISEGFFQQLGMGLVLKQSLFKASSPPMQAGQTYSKPIHKLS